MTHHTKAIVSQGDYDTIMDACETDAMREYMAGQLTIYEPIPEQDQE